MTNTKRSERAYLRLLLEVEGVHFLQFSFLGRRERAFRKVIHTEPGSTHESEEEGGLIGLERGLRVKNIGGLAGVVLGLQDGSCTQLLDELGLQSVGEPRRRVGPVGEGGRNLLERLVVHEAGPILRDVQLSLLKVFSEFPAHSNVRAAKQAGTRPSASEA